MNDSVSVTSESLKSRILGGQGTGEGFERFRHEAGSGLRASFDPAARRSARELFHLYAVRRIASESAGAPNFGFEEALAELESRGDDGVLYAQFVGVENVYVVFSEPTGSPFACLAVARHEAPPLGEDGGPVQPRRWRKG